MSHRITDERLEKMRADQQQFADWTDDADDRNDALEIVAALRELQQLRKAVAEYSAYLGPCHHDQNPAYCPDAARGDYCRNCPKRLTELCRTTPESYQ